MEQDAESGRRVGGSMKLYFYSLRTNKDFGIYIKVEEREVFKEGGLYRPRKDLFPLGNGCFQNPKHIGKLQIAKWGFELPYVVLEESNIEHVKQVFIEEYIDKKIEFHEKKIEELKEKREAIRQVKG